MASYVDDPDVRILNKKKRLLNTKCFDNTMDLIDAFIGLLNDELNE
jgi:hypothetical protein